METVLREQSLGKKILINVDRTVTCNTADGTQEFTYDVVSPDIEPDMVDRFWGWSNERQSIFVSSGVPVLLQDWVARLEYYRHLHQSRLAEAVRETLEDVPIPLLESFIQTVGKFCLLLRDDSFSEEPSDQSNQANEALAILTSYARA